MICAPAPYRMITCIISHVQQSAAAQGKETTASQPTMGVGGGGILKPCLVGCTALQHQSRLWQSLIIPADAWIGLFQTRQIKINYQVVRLKWCSCRLFPSRQRKCIRYCCLSPQTNTIIPRIHSWVHLGPLGQGEIKIIHYVCRSNQRKSKHR